MKGKPPPTIFERTRTHPEVSRYPEFCAELLRRFPEADQNFLFLERDALPLMWTMEELIGPAEHGRLHKVYLNIKMMPTKLKKGFPPEAATPAETFAARSKYVAGYAKLVRHRRSRLMRFLRRELASVPIKTVLVDTGFWGSMPVFIAAAFPKKNFEMFWFVGPSGAPAMLHEPGPEHSAQRVEHFFQWDYEAEELFENLDGRVAPRRMTRAGDFGDQLAEQKRAVVDLAAAYRRR